MTPMPMPIPMPIPTAAQRPARPLSSRPTLPMPMPMPLSLSIPPWGPLPLSPAWAPLPPAPLSFERSAHRATTPVLRMAAVGLGDTSLSFSAQAGEIVHLQGGSPVARLRVLALAAGFAQGGSGRCEILGQDVLAMEEAPRRAWREQHIARVLSCDPPPDGPSVLASVAAPLLRRGASPAEARRRAAFELAAMGAAAWGARAPSTLTRAEARLVLLARATAQRPRLLVLEQPEADLPPAAVAALRLGLQALATGCGTCVVMTSAQSQLIASAQRCIDLDCNTGVPQRGLS